MIDPAFVPYLRAVAKHTQPDGWADAAQVGAEVHGIPGHTATTRAVLNDLAAREAVVVSRGRNYTLVQLADAGRRAISEAEEGA